MRRLLGILGVLLGSASLSVSFALIGTNFAAIQKALGASAVEIQWMMNIYGIFIAATLVAMGRLGDLHGRKKLYLIGNLLLGVSMLGAGLSEDAGWVIGFMALYGVAGAMILPLSQSLMLHYFPEDKKSKAVGIWATVGGLSMAAGPLIGGLLLFHLSWHWLFFINVPLAILTVGLVYFFCEESKSAGPTTHLDWRGVAMLILTIGILTLAIVQSNLWHPVVIVGLFLASLISVVFLLIFEYKAEVPIIREDLFTNKMFLLSALSAFCMTALFWAALFLVPLYVQKVLGYDSLRSGMLMLFFTLPGALFASLSALLYDRIGAKLQIFIGFFLVAISIVMLTRVHIGTSFFFLALSMLKMAIGFTLILTPAMTAALSTLSKNFSGVSAGTFVTIQEIGGSVGLALTVTVVRMERDLSIGFHHGAYVMLILCTIGLGASCLMPKKPKQKGVLQKALER